MRLHDSNRHGPGRELSHEAGGIWAQLPYKEKVHIAGKIEWEGPLSAARKSVCMKADGHAGATIKSRSILKSDIHGPGGMHFLQTCCSIRCRSQHADLCETLTEGNADACGDSSYDGVKANFHLLLVNHKVHGQLCQVQVLLPL